MISLRCPSCKNFQKYNPSKHKPTLVKKKKKCVFCNSTFSVSDNKKDKVRDQWIEEASKALKENSDLKLEDVFQNINTYFGDNFGHILDKEPPATTEEKKTEEKKTEKPLNIPSQTEESTVDQKELTPQNQIQEEIKDMTEEEQEKYFIDKANEMTEEASKL